MKSAATAHRFRTAAHFARHDVSMLRNGGASSGFHQQAPAIATAKMHA